MSSCPDHHPAPSGPDAPARPAPFRSILFADADVGPTAGEPDFFHDLNLDQAVESVTVGRDEYDLAPFFHQPLADVDVIAYRQGVFQDIEKRGIHDLLVGFARRMSAMRDDQRKATRSHYPYSEQRWYLNAVGHYCDAVTTLAAELAEADVTSRGLLGLRDHLVSYRHSDRFTTLLHDTRALQRDLDAVRYCLLINGNRVTVGAYDDEADYSTRVADTFRRFQQELRHEHRTRFPGSGAMNHVEAGILDLLAKVFPELFARLSSFCQDDRDYLDETVGTFDREIQFYLAYLAYLSPLRDAGLPVSYPEVSARSKTEQAVDTFDLALAAQLTRDARPVVRNDLHLSGQERILVVSGPNNGGKTTTARTFGQLYHLARLGCPVPGRDVRLFVCDQILTYFERKEELDTLAGKLQDELNRLREAFGRATPDSLLILNEMFSSTTLQDALFLSGKVLGRVSELDALCVCVTFIDELATLNDKTVSMVSTVDPGHPATRTYRVVRRPADGHAFALAVAEKYRLTYDLLSARIAS